MQTIGQELLDDLLVAGALQLHPVTLGYGLLFQQFALVRAGLDAIVPDTKKSFGGGNLTATSGVIHDTAGGNLISQTNLEQEGEETGNFGMRFEIDLSDLPSQGFLEKRQPR